MVELGPEGKIAPLLYRVFLYLAFPFIMLRLFFRAVRERAYFEGIPQRLGFAGIRPPPGGIWIHAVSVGEVNAATPLIQYLLEKYPHQAVTLTTMTPTGAERVRNTFAGRVEHCYLPYDYPGAVRRFLDAVRPQLALVMETEIWPNLIERCHQLGVPMLYVNVRMSRRSWRGYRRFVALITPALVKIRRFAVQSRPDARRLLRLGAPAAALKVTGSIKFDVVLPPSIGEAAQSVRRGWGRERPVWVAGSTHEGEESQIIEAFGRIRREAESPLLVIAPRHPQRGAAVLRLCARHAYRAVLRSETAGKVSADTEIYVADTMGELPMLIAAGDVAFIGGSLVPVGGHNILEASAVGIPVVFGRYMFNFAEIAGLVLQQDAGIQVMNGDELAEVVLRLLADPQLRDQYASRGRKLVEQNRGALERVCALVDAEMAAGRAVREILKKSSDIR